MRVPLPRKTTGSRPRGRKAIFGGTPGLGSLADDAHASPSHIPTSTTAPSRPSTSSRHMASDLQNDSSERDVDGNEGRTAVRTRIAANSAGSYGLEPTADGWIDGRAAVSRSRSNVRGTGGQPLSELWNLYYMSTDKSPTTKRYQAKCRYCSTVMPGRVERMFRHSMKNCPDIPMVKRQEAAILHAKARAKKEIEVDLLSTAVASEGQIIVDYAENWGAEHEATDTGVAEAQAPSTPAAPSTISANLTSSQQTPLRVPAKLPIRIPIRSLGPASQEHSDHLLVRAFVDAGVSFSVADNQLFQDLLKSLNPSYDPPSSKTLSEKLVAEEYAKCKFPAEVELASLETINLSVGGWANKDKSATRIILANSTQLQQYPVVVDIFRVQTEKEENTKRRLDVSLREQGISWHKIKVVVFSPFMETTPFFHDFIENFPDTINLRCMSDAFNAVIAGFLRHSVVTSLLEKSCRIVKYFMGSDRFGPKLRSWATIQKKPDIWGFEVDKLYTVAAFLKNYSDRVDGFRWCLSTTSRDHRTDSASTVPPDVQELIGDKDFLLAHEMCQMLISGMAKAAQDLETHTPSIGDAVYYYLRAYKELDESEIPSEYTAVKQNCLSIMKDRFRKIFDNALYAVGLLLHPKYRELALSRAYSFRDAYADALLVASRWNFVRIEAKEMRTALKQYCKAEGVFASFKWPSSVEDPYLWWENLGNKVDEQLGLQALRKLSMLIHSVTPKVHGLESVRHASSLLSPSRAWEGTNVSENETPTLKQLTTIKLACQKRNAISDSAGADSMVPRPSKRLRTSEPTSFSSRSTYLPPMLTDDAVSQWLAQTWKLDDIYALPDGTLEEEELRNEENDNRDITRKPQGSGWLHILNLHGPRLEQILSLQGDLFSSAQHEGQLSHNDEYALPRMTTEGGQMDWRPEDLLSSSDSENDV